MSEVPLYRAEHLLASSVIYHAHLLRLEGPADLPRTSLWSNLTPSPIKGCPGLWWA